MRLLPGQPQELAGKSIDSYSLVKHAINNPDVLPRVWELFREEESPLSAILSMKGLSSKGLFDNMNTSDVRVVKSNHVQYPIKSSDKRKVHFVANGSGVTFVCDAYPTQPGKKQSVITFWLDSNWVRPKELMELADNRTLLYVYTEHEPVEDQYGFRYQGKVWAKTRETFIDPFLLGEGMEAAPVMAPYEQDFSETGSEKYTFDGWGDAYMTLQRVKFSYSGTAAAMSASRDWYAFQNSKGATVYTYIDHADKLMMKRAADYHEYAVIFGQGTVTVDGEVLMKDNRGREIMAGDGILYQGDGAYEYPMNGDWTIRQLESIMNDADVRSGKDGLLEVVFLAGNENLSSFNRMMRANGFVTQNNNVEGSGADKGVINTYSFYEVNGVRIIPKKFRYFDNLSRPSLYLPDGTRRSSWDGIFVPIGQTAGGDRGIELIQLRPMKKGSVDGINVGGKMATSVDGSSVHCLFQTGVVSRNKISRIFRYAK